MSLSDEMEYPTAGGSPSGPETVPVGAECLPFFDFTPVFTCEGPDVPSSRRLRAGFSEREAASGPKHVPGPVIGRGK